MGDRFTCKKCGRVVSSDRYGGKRSTEYWSLKKFGLCPTCLRGPRPPSYLVEPHKIRRFYRRRLVSGAFLRFDRMNSPRIALNNGLTFHRAALGRSEEKSMGERISHLNDDYTSSGMYFPIVARGSHENPSSSLCLISSEQRYSHSAIKSEV